MKGHLQGSWLSCHGYTELPGLSELEEALVTLMLSRVQSSRLAGSAGLQLPCGDPAALLLLHPAAFLSSHFPTLFFKC